MAEAKRIDLNDTSDYLRYWCDLHTDPEFGVIDTTRCTVIRFRAAANEIDRLRAENARLKLDNQRLADALDTTNWHEYRGIVVQLDGSEWYVEDLLLHYPTAAARAAIDAQRDASVSGGAQP